MGEFIEHMSQLWKSDDKLQLIDQAEKIVDFFKQASHSSGNMIPEEPLLTLAVDKLYALSDPVYGGLKGEPKFPMGYQSLFLMEYGKVKGDSRAIFCAELTFDKMLAGGDLRSARRGVF